MQAMLDSQRVEVSGKPETFDSIVSAESKEQEGPLPVFGGPETSRKRSSSL